VLFTSARVLLVQRDQLSYEGLPLLLRHLKVNCRIEGRTDQRLDGSEKCSGGKRSVFCSGGGFCLVRPVKSIPRSLLVNRFTVLNVEEANTDICEPIDTPLLSTPNQKVLPRKPKWEKRLPKQLSTIN